MILKCFVVDVVFNVPLLF